MVEVWGVLKHTSRTPANHVHSLGVFLESREVGDLPFFAIGVDFPYSDVTITACSCQSAFAMRFEVGGIDGAVFVVPGHEEGSGFHDDKGGAGSQPRRRGCVNKMSVKQRQGEWEAEVRQGVSAN